MDVSTPAKQLGVAILEDDTALVSKLTHAIDSAPQLHVVASFNDVHSCANWLEASAPEIFLVDLQLPDGSGVEIIRKAAEKNVACIVLTAFADERSVVSALQAGATGYLLKDSDDPQIVESIILVANGESPINPKIANFVLKYFAPPPPDTSVEYEVAHLSAREKDVLTLIAQGRSYSEVGNRLQLSINTVRSHIRRIYQKLDVNSSGEAVYRATRQQLISG